MTTSLKSQRYSPFEQTSKTAHLVAAIIVKYRELSRELAHCTGCDTCKEAKIRRLVCLLLYFYVRLLDLMMYRVLCLMYNTLLKIELKNFTL